MVKRYQEPQPNQEASSQPVKIDFDAWWAMNEKKIPPQHLKEIVKADFSARGLSLKEPVKAYNEALGKYGLKLK